MGERRSSDVLSPGELKAELDSLRTLRRRSLSTNPDGRIDPDLPGQSLNASPSSPPFSPRSPTEAVSASDDTDAPLSGQVDSLFWLPAHLHPEIAPQQFKEFIKEQTTPEALARRSASVSRSSSLRSQGSMSASTSINRRKSTLSRQIDPSEADSDGIHARSPQRSDSSTRLRRRGTQLDRLTLADLHKLEELSQAAREGAPEGEEQLMRNILERSVSSSVLDASKSGGETPLHVPAPGSILRRSAISKVRKPSLLGDGGGHRFGPSRRPSRRMSDHTSDRTSSAEPQSPSLSDHGHGATAGATLTTSPIMEDDTALPPKSSEQPSLRLDTSSLGVDSNRPVPEHKRSASDDSFLDAYINQSPIDNRSSWPSAGSPVSPPDTVPAVEPSHKQWPSEEIHVAEPYSAPSPSKSIPPQSASAPALIPVSSSYAPQPSAALAHAPIPAPAPGPSEQQSLPPAPSKEKPEKKSAWARFGLSRVASSIRDDGDSDDAASTTSTSSHGSHKKKDKRNKKSSAPEREATDEGKEKESGSGFLSGLFSSSSSKKRHEQADYATQQQVVLPTSSGCFRDGEFVNFYRLPIHVERAVYRLSHLKLANPKRALYEQVLISNLMFWYLSAMNQPKPPNQPMTSAEMLDLAEPQSGRGSPNPVAPLDLPMPDTQTPKGPPGSNQPVISPLSSYPPANSSMPAPQPEVAASPSSPPKKQQRQRERAPQEAPRADAPQESLPLSSEQHRPHHQQRPQEAFKVMRGNTSSRDQRVQQNPQHHEPHSAGNAALLANHRKHQGRDIPWEQQPRDGRRSPPEQHQQRPQQTEVSQRPRREASLQQQGSYNREDRPPMSKSPEGSRTRGGRQEHIAV